MAEERLDLLREVFNKIEYIKTINTSFSELGVTSINEDLEKQVTVGQFFELYNQLFYDIPANGEINSHQYLVRTSGDYINFDEINDEIAALQAEIAQLRTDLLNAQMEVAKQQVAQTGDEKAIEEVKVIQEELESANTTLVETNTRISEQTTTSTNSTSIQGSTGGSGGSVSTGGSLL
jgi:hypothetical protein